VAEHPTSRARPAGSSTTAGQRVLQQVTSGSTTTTHYVAGVEEVGDTAHDDDDGVYSGARRIGLSVKGWSATGWTAGQATVTLNASGSAPERV